MPRGAAPSLTPKGLFKVANVTGDFSLAGAEVQPPRLLELVCGGGAVVGDGAGRLRSGGTRVMPTRMPDRTTTPIAAKMRPTRTTPAPHHAQAWDTNLVEALT